MAAPAPLLFPLAPDASEAPTVTLAWRTDVLRAGDGTEQRVRLRATPAETLGLTVGTLTEADTTRLLGLLAGAAAGTDGAALTAARYQVPRWPDRIRVAPPGAAAGATVVPLADDATLRGFVPGGAVLCYRDDRTTQVATIAGGGVGAASLTLTAGLAAPLTDAWVVVPLVTARLLVPVDVVRDGATCATARLRFRVESAASAEAQPAGAAAVVAALALQQVPSGGTSYGDGAYTGVTFVLRAVPADAAGLALPTAPVVWTSTDPVHLPVHATGDPCVAVVPTGAPGPGATATITATVGAVSATRALFVLGR